jgi:RNA polymerase sigma-70 factor (ECF subfamily)
MHPVHLRDENQRLTHVFVACQSPSFSPLSAVCEPVEFKLRAAFGPVREQRPSMSTTKDSDRQLEAELLARIAAGEEAAFATLYDRFSPGLFSLVMKMVRDEKEAEDVLQEGFSHIWRRAATYDATRSGAFTWAVMIFRNKAIDHLRVRQRQQRTTDRVTEEFAHSVDGADFTTEEVDHREESVRVRSALGEIPSDQKAAIELAFFGGLTHEEISEKLGTPLGTVKARIRRGLLKLRECLKEAV